MTNEKKTLAQKISQADWDSARQFIDLPTGIRMSYVEMGDPEGAPLILQHGMTDNNRVWSLSAPYFCEAGYHVYMPDLRGMGYSDQPDGFYTVFHYATDIKAFMDVMGIGKAVMVGHSLGSFTVQAFLTMFPGMCEKVVLVATATLKTNDKAAAFYKMAASLPEDGHPDDSFIDLWYGNQNSVPEDFLSRVKAESQRLSAKAWVNICGGVCVSSLEPLYPFIDRTVPLLMLFGSGDSFMNAAARDDILRKLPHAHWREYEGIGHNIQYEIPRQFAQDVLRWLNEGKL